MPQQLDKLIFDRTAADVAQLKAVTAKLVDRAATAEEKAAFLAGMKGAYNDTDLNRVGAAVAYLHSAIGVPGVPRQHHTGDRLAGGRHTIARTDGAVSGQYCCLAGPSSLCRPGRSGGYGGFNLPGGQRHRGDIVHIGGRVGGHAVGFSHQAGQYIIYDCRRCI